MLREITNSKGIIIIWLDIILPHISSDFLKVICSNLTMAKATRILEQQDTYVGWLFESAQFIIKISTLLTNTLSSVGLSCSHMAHNPTLLGAINPTHARDSDRASQNPFLGIWTWNKERDFFWETEPIKCIPGLEKQKLVFREREKRKQVCMSEIR